MTPTTQRTLLAAAVLSVGLTSRAASPIAVMILDGESGGPYHKWQLTTAVLKKELDETRLFHVDVVTAPRCEREVKAIARRDLGIARFDRELLVGVAGRTVTGAAVFAPNAQETERRERRIVERDRAREIGRA